MYAGHVKRLLEIQGFGLHTPERATEAVVDDLIALAAHLGKRQSQGRHYLFGRKPSSFDATLFSTLGVVLGAPFNHPIVQAARNLPALAKYVAHIQGVFFPSGWEKEAQGFLAHSLSGPSMKSVKSEKPPVKCTACSFVVTGGIKEAPNHCCLRCKNQNGADHGPRCQRIEFVPLAEAEEDAEQEAEAPAATV
eukprot:1884337-Prymnesium_polylepis.2